MKKSKEDIFDQQRKFLGVCPICGQPLKKIPNVNVLRCENTYCRGVPSSNSSDKYEPYYRLLSPKAMKTYGYLFKKKK